MALTLINHLKTIETVNNGVITWSNPSVNVSITSDGKVINNETLQELSMNAHDVYNIRILDKSGKMISRGYSFNSLYANFVLGVSIANRTLALKDPKLGYTKGNVKIIKLKMSKDLY